MSGFCCAINGMLCAEERNLDVLTNAPEKAMTFLFWIPISGDVLWATLGWGRESAPECDFWMSNLTQFTRAGGEVQGRKIVFAFFAG